ncbi:MULTISPECIES: hypothetical protein [Pseudomonas]|uniref:Uncharacterized protein n=1 Tax=Pseudomonas shahriarae TaxID=2745512 RepID=A0ABT5NC11_9PSED|nr:MULTISPECIES: hypothetical protein [Pseudomonas]MDD0985347.1 hypothetical protein [Pseudomonas shahriarae]MDD1033457.1 hypothetical protein [Pseudomonas shahriarae]PHN59841.1 hypothetical protein AO268_17365 [Pseudomonas sp. ICMP 8385]
MSGFADQYLCTFRLTPAEAALRQAAERYVSEAEAYDRTVCTGPIGKDGILPATPRERAQINRNANFLLTRIAGEHAHLFSRSELLREIGRVDRLGAPA